MKSLLAGMALTLAAAPAALAEAYMPQLDGARVPGGSIAGGGPAYIRQLPEGAQPAPPPRRAPQRAQRRAAPQPAQAQAPRRQRPEVGSGVALAIAPAGAASFPDVGGGVVRR